MFFGKGVHFTEKQTDLGFEELSKLDNCDDILGHLMLWMDLDASDLKKALKEDIVYQNVIEPLINNICRDSFSRVKPTYSLLMDHGISYLRELCEVLWSDPPSPQSRSHYDSMQARLSTLKTKIRLYCVLASEQLSQVYAELSDGLKEMEIKEFSSGECEGYGEDDAPQELKADWKVKLSRREYLPSLPSKEQITTTTTTSNNSVEPKLNTLNHSLSHAWYYLLDILRDGCKTEATILM